MRRAFKRIPMFIFIAINLLMIVAMNFCAYTSHLHPQDYPDWSFFGMAFPVFLAANVGFLLFWFVFKRRFMLLSVVGMLACADSVRTYWPVNISEDVPEGSIKVMTYNVMYFGDGVLPEWEKNTVVYYILTSGADIVCLQEAIKGGEERVMELFGEEYPYIDKPKDENKNLMCLSKFPILKVEQIEYESKTNMSIAYDLLVGEDTVTVINNHLESYKLQETDKEDYKNLIRHPKEEDAEAKYEGLTDKVVHATLLRSAEVDSVAAYMERRGDRLFIVCGDFNDPSISYTHWRLTRMLDDAYTRSGNGPGISYNKNGMYFRIDNILCSPGFEAFGAKVDNSIDTSDHYPVFCYLKKREK